MKIQRVITFVCLILSAAVSSAQNRKMIVTDVKTEAVYKKEAIVYKSVTTFYLNESQVIKLSLEGNNDLTATVDNGTIINKGGGFFIVNPARLGKLMMKVYGSKDTVISKAIAINEFKVVALPKIECIYAGVKTGNITRMKFLSDSTIRFSDEDMPLAYQYKTVSFKISVTVPGGAVVKDVPSNGNKLPEKIRNLIASASVGTKISIDYIKAKLEAKSFDGFENAKPADGTVHLMESMSLVISD